MTGSDPTDDTGTSGPSARKSPSRNKDPLHGVTLEAIVTSLQARFGWTELGRHIRIRCFTDKPSVKSSLIFLRKTPWARTKVEQLYIRTLGTPGQDRTDSP